MTEVFEHNPDDHEDPASGSTFLIGLIGAILLVATIPALTAWYYYEKRQQEHVAVAVHDFDEPARLTEAQVARLTGAPRWERRDDGAGEIEALVIPIDRAMQLIVDEMGQR